MNEFCAVRICSNPSIAGLKKLGSNRGHQLCCVEISRSGLQALVAEWPHRCRVLHPPVAALSSNAPVHTLAG